MKILLLPIFLMLVSCGGNTSSIELRTQQDELLKNRALWNLLSIDAYQYSFRRRCYCMPEDDIVVVINDGAIENAFYTPAGTYLKGRRLDNIKTVDQYFDLIQEAIDHNVDSLVVEYDPDYGYPELISIDTNFNLADEEITYTILSFQ